MRLDESKMRENESKMRVNVTSICGIILSSKNRSVPTGNRQALFYAQFFELILHGSFWGKNVRGARKARGFGV